MTFSHNSELDELARLLSDPPPEANEVWTPEWMARESLLSRQTEVLQQVAIEAQEFEVEVAISGEPVLSGSIESGFLGRFLTEAQMTISSVAQAIMRGDKPKGPLGVDVLENSKLRLVATQPGSFVLGFVGPVRHSEPTMPEVDDDEVPPLPLFDEALSKLLGVFDAVEHDVATERLPGAIADLGGHRAVRHLTELAKLVASHGAATSVTTRSPFLDKPRSVGLSSAGARRLSTMLSRTHVDVESLPITGSLTGIRWRSSLFDLELPDGRVISGKVARDLRDVVRNLFDRVVTARIDQTTTRMQLAEEATVTYQLVELQQARPLKFDLGTPPGGRPRRSE
jgi:hypothetical protein